MLAVGARVYEANCIQCHGVNGDGRGTAVAELVVAPTDFRRQQASLAASLRALREGMLGTRMAPWTDRLNADEILAVAHYVRSLYQDTSTQHGATTVISSIIVIASLVLGLAFVVAWCCSPALRRWVERPKYSSSPGSSGTIGRAGGIVEDSAHEASDAASTADRHRRRRRDWRARPRLRPVQPTTRAGRPRRRCPPSRPKSTGDD